jgi:basic amino acid/polyamine antiporter, APA family
VAFTASPPARGHQPRSLGLWTSSALVAGNMIGSGIFLLPASLAAFGSVSLVGWGLTATGALLLALVFASLGRAYPRTGGPYEYSRRAFGDFIGFQVGWGYWIAIWAGNAAIAVAVVSYAGEFWRTLTENALVGALGALACIWLLTAVNSMGVRTGGQVQLVTTVLKLLPLIAIAAVGVFWIDRDLYTPFNASETSWWRAVTAAAPLTLWAFIGLESATVPADEVKDPTRNIPRSTIIGTLVATAVYVLGTAVVMGVVPMATLQTSTAPFADAARSMWGDSAGNLVALGAMISAFGALNGWILLQGQIPMAAARDRLFPALFARTTANGTPVIGLVISSVFATVLMLMNYSSGLVNMFTTILLLATLTTLIPYAFSSMAQVVLLVTDRKQFQAAHFARDVSIASLAFAYAMWAMWGSGQDTLAYGVMLLIGGTPVYVWMRWEQHRQQAREAVRPEVPVPLPAAAPAVPVR